MFLQGEYNYWITAIAIVILFLASLASMNIFNRLMYVHGRHRYFLQVAGAIVMGLGIWAFQFIALLSFNLLIYSSVTMGYTILSITISLFMAFVFISTMANDDKQYTKIVVIGTLYGINLVVMHYLNIEAVSMEAEVIYEPKFSVLAMVIAIGAAFVLVRLFVLLRKFPGRILQKLTLTSGMTITIFIVHHFFMQSTNYYLEKQLFLFHHSINLFSLLIVMIAVVIIFIVSWGIMFFDRTVLEKMAYEDPLTHLANRHEMNRFFESFQGNGSIAILFIDVDQFKAVNDSLGHPVGDQVIVEIAERLRSIAQDEHLVFRIGGDEFLFLIENKDEEKLGKIAEQILQVLKESIEVDDQTVYVTASVGISVAQLKSEGIQLNDLLQRADIAMFHAKLNGKNQYCFYDEALGEAERRRTKILQDLRKAMDDKQFYLMYQPKWHVKKKELFGFEALLRWKHPELGSIPPSEFIPLAEESGHIIPLTRWIIEEACKQGMEWYEQNLIQPISVNLSTKLFQSEYLLIWLEEILQETGLPAHLLELEITESMVLQDIDEVTLQLGRIRHRGVRVAMDDFGVGYSSIGLLDRIPIDAIKLDRLFMENLHEANKRAIIHAIIMMAHTLELDVIAEGVETEKQVSTLLQLGCFIMQGYYYSRPLKARDVLKWEETFLLTHVNE